ncbi:MAG: hypothetical protein ACFFB2_09335 [Promethearchaeota archaeon]
MANAITTAKKNDLNLLIAKITEIKSRIEAELKKWEILFQRNAFLQERLEQARFERYIEELKKYITHVTRFGSG